MGRQGAFRGNAASSASAISAMKAFGLSPTPKRRKRSRHVASHSARVVRASRSNAPNSGVRQRWLPRLGRIRYRRPVLRPRPRSEQCLAQTRCDLPVIRQGIDVAVRNATVNQRADVELILRQAAPDSAGRFRLNAFRSISSIGTYREYPSASTPSVKVSTIWWMSCARRRFLLPSLRSPGWHRS